MPDSFQKKLRYEIQQIEQLLDSFQPLLDVVKIREPDIIELSALATVLHSLILAISETWCELKQSLVQLLDMEGQRHQNP